MKFELTEKEQEKFRKWQAKHQEIYTGAIGGRYTFCFTPTSLGDIVIVKDEITKEEINLTDYDSW